MARNQYKIDHIKVLLRTGQVHTFDNSFIKYGDIDKSIEIYPRPDALRFSYIELSKIISLTVGKVLTGSKTKLKREFDHDTEVHFSNGNDS